MSVRYDELDRIDFADLTPDLDFLEEVKRVDAWVVERYGGIPDSRAAYEEAVLEYYSFNTLVDPVGES